MSSKTIIPDYRVEFTTADGSRYEAFSWPAKHLGKTPTDESLAQFVADLEASHRPGGVNSHLPEVKFVAALAVANTTLGDVVAIYTAAA